MHEANVDFTGDARRAFDTALQTLQPLGFEIVEQNSFRLVVTGPGFNNTRQNALLGISRAEFNAEHSRLAVKADLGGLDRFQKIMLTLMIGAGALDALLLIALWYFLEELHAQTWFLAIPVLVFIPWIFIAPLITRWILERTKDALATLLNAMAKFA